MKYFMWKHHFLNQFLGNCSITIQCTINKYDLQYNTRNNVMLHIIINIYLIISKIILIILLWRIFNTLTNS